MQTALVAPDEGSDICSMEYRTLLIGTEAYAAMTGVFPVTETDLVSAGLLLREVADFDLVIAADDYQVVAVGERCSGFEPDNRTSAPDGPGPTEPTVDTEPPPPEQPNCKAERKTLETASEAYAAEHGVLPVTEADLVPMYLRAESDGFDLVGGVIVPVAGICA